MTVLEHEKIFDLPLKRHSVSPRTDSGLGLLEPLLSDDSITDIMINRFDRIFIERNGQLLKSSIHLDSPESLLFLAESLIRAAGKEHMVENTPIIDGMLPDGSRVTIILFPVVPAGPSISIRKFPANPLTLDMMVSHSNLTPPMARFLKAATRLRLNILIAGNTSSGKTTLLNAICGHMDAHERIVTIEDTQELRIQQENVVRMVTCAANSHPGGRDITPADLIKSA
ncbi:MAG: CpaF family protein, partial [Alphaproteobacteria bacterium]|nr:CpaF family protein [Alphaproteobacteria bacterium]